MIKRRIHDKRDESIDHSPAVGLWGPRQVGKTTLALEMGATRPSSTGTLPLAAAEWISE